MSDDNKYMRAGQRRTMAIADDGDEDVGPAWNYAEEAYGQKQAEVVEATISHPSGVQALLAADPGEQHDLWYGEAVVRFESPRIPADGMKTLQDHFPASFQCEGEDAWIVGFTKFHIDADTRQRVVTVYVASTGPLAQLRDLPSPSPLFVDRHYPLIPTNFVVREGEP